MNFKTLRTSTNLFVFFIQWKKLFTLTLGTEFSRTSILFLNWCYGICDRVSKLFESSHTYIVVVPQSDLKFCFWHKLQVLKGNIEALIISTYNQHYQTKLKQGFRSCLTFEAHLEPRYGIRNINYPIFKKIEIKLLVEYSEFPKFEKSRMNRH